MANLLRPGDGFGEEALILGGTRTATAKMAAHGELPGLEKDDFHELIAASQAEMASAAVANTMLDEGYRLLEIRYEEKSAIIGELIDEIGRGRRCFRVSRLRVRKSVPGSNRYRLASQASSQ
ncbi:MAG: cyclic nucleotide-binding domain-containing protein [Thiohalocapsa sp.]|nr:cyclic nucleotide-binding domain-containing protein [Thiohalocapsa sp.]MCF7990792.1 cyclic nucleotide-binding domain-containing protein [Thiohalocapsa sp.]